MLLKLADDFRKARKLAQSPTIATQRLETLHDLLDATRATEPEKVHLLSMLSATVGHISLVFQEPSDKIATHRLLGVKADLQRHLRERGFRRNSIRSYTKYLRILLQKARNLGWTECAPELASAWQETRLATSKVAGCSAIIRYALRKNIAPNDFSEFDLGNWADDAVWNGSSYEYARNVKAKFRKCIFQLGLGSKFPHVLPPSSGRRYGIQLSRFPEPIRTEVRHLLHWKSAEFAAERPIRAKNRAVTIKSLETLLSRMFGFLVGIRGEPIPDLRGLLSKNSVVEYVDWAINERAKAAHGVWVELGRIGGLRAYPGLGGQDFSWLPKLTAQLPREHETGVRERNERNWIPHALLLEIPDRIRKDIARMSYPTDRVRAEAHRDALLISMLVTLPWRQRNYRECKVLPFADGGNLSKEEISSNSTIAKPSWVEEALRLNPHERFWQFRIPPRKRKPTTPFEAFYRANWFLRSKSTLTITGPSSWVVTMTFIRYFALVGGTCSLRTMYFA